VVRGWVQCGQKSCRGERMCFSIVVEGTQDLVWGDGDYYSTS
jgi:hypothetical protein